MIVQLVIMGLVSFLVYCHVRHKIRYSERNKQLDRFRKAPIPNLPFIGQLWYFVGSYERFYQLLDHVLPKLDKRPVVLWFTAYMPTVHLTDAEDVEEFSKQCTNREMYGMSEGTLNAVISFRNYRTWNKVRRIMDPAFGTTSLPHYLKVLDVYSKTLVDVLESKAVTGQIFNIHPIFLTTNVDMMMGTATGVKIDNQKGSNENYPGAIEAVFKSIVIRVGNPLLWMNFTFSIYKRFTGLNKRIENLRTFSTQAVNEARRNRVDVIESEVKENPEYAGKRRVLIDLFFEAQNSDPCLISEECIRDEILHIGASGHEISITMSFLLLMFGIHQDAQETVYREIASAFSDESQQITMDGINRLHYLEQCLKETLRLFSIVPSTVRRTLSPVTLPSGEIIPADTQVLLHLKNVHYNATYYPNPEAWNPDNFSPEAIERRPQNSFAAFGFGNRACMGSKLLVVAIKVQASRILRRYRVHTGLKLNEIVLVGDFARKNRNGYPVRLEAREPVRLTSL